MILYAKNAAPPRRRLFDPNIAHFKFKNLIFFHFLPFFRILHFSKTKKLAALLDLHDITHLLDKI
jgi:hypothetical protein